MRIKIAALLIAALALSACAKEAEEELPTETIETTVSTEPEKNYSLVRSWTMNELFDSLYAGERDFSFPIDEKEFEDGGLFSDCSFSDNRIIFPDRSSLTVQSHPDSHIIYYLTAEKKTAPPDFTVNGIALGISYFTVRDDFGIPDAISGKPDEEKGSLTYYGAAGQQFIIEFENKKAVKFTLIQG